jgi:LPXTG-site transpeptidase (sortase) family protein
MLNSKYSKVLTIILILAIVVIVGLLIFVGVDWYKAYTVGKDTQNSLDQFNSYIENNQNNDNNANFENNIDNNNIIEEPNNNNIIEEPSDNNNNSNSEGLTYKGFKVAGVIEIPKTKVKYNVLDDPSAKAMEVGITIIYGPGLNQTGNTVLAGHNYRNGTFFSNNNKLSSGDKIYITDLSGKKVTYTIYKKYKTDPNDFSYATRNTNGKREISLTTCTDDSSARIIIWAKED